MAIDNGLNQDKTNDGSFTNMTMKLKVQKLRSQVDVKTRQLLLKKPARPRLQDGQVAPPTSREWLRW
ncbi:uncharacterized protein GLRG_11929 [Colletotrichum graminicola M1.001]|uniref:Uncharacterized protein n=1 Tax=Colletotrichum graminicola (strain M1.001 / M2 / FGSC 10212) TaxID=645133 RepID=E3R0Z3_COLGM|nr:uncharacterized protein GLRG_11929 [Colletotrichum graminicola M1.001]EFQ36781.1 hypothetical protein GLRG_11929 [Colletotrichum graminicola M1.001]